MLPAKDDDPIEAAVPWAALQAAGHEVLFATPDGNAACATVEDEVKLALADPDDFKAGGPLPIHDRKNLCQLGFVVRDGNYLSVRWPGDCHRFAQEFLQMLACS